MNVFLCAGADLGGREVLPFSGRAHSEHAAAGADAHHLMSKVVFV